METSKLLTFAEPTDTVSFVEGPAPSEPTPRRLDRFDKLPHPPAQTIAPDDATEIRRACDELEVNIDRSLLGI